MTVAVWEQTLTINNNDCARCNDVKQIYRMYNITPGESPGYYKSRDNTKYLSIYDIYGEILHHRQILTIGKLCIFNEMLFIRGKVNDMRKDTEQGVVCLPRTTSFYIHRMFLCYKLHTRLCFGLS